MANERVNRAYRFLNPYNFVRSLLAKNSAAAPLLGRCMPPPHDRYIAFTGRITCRLTAMTPLFISDSHGVFRESAEPRDHLHYRFFRNANDGPAIPATSLRGAIRSVFEAATNSCFSILTGHKRLSYHLPPEEALKLVPARVHKVGENWELELLTGTTPLVIGQRPRGPQYAAWVRVYDPLRPSQTVGKVPTHPYSKRKKLSLNGWGHKKECWAIIEFMKHPLRHFEFWNVVAVADSPDKLKAEQGQRLIHGYFCITNHNIENKHDERLFFRADDNNVGPRRVELPELIRRRYNELIDDYQDRHTAEVRKRERRRTEDQNVPPADQPWGKEPAFSRFIVPNGAAELTDGDLVYVMLEPVGESFQAKFIVPVSVPRVSYEKTIADRLAPEALRKCDHYTRLCPACRLFGWVWGTGAPGEARPPVGVVTGYSGRVRFSHACLTRNAGTFDATLAILSNPKPTTTRFYLMPKGSNPRDGLEDRAVDYDSSDQVTRGRKIYRHHGNQLSTTEYTSVNGQKSDQNRTVHDVQSIGSVFEFRLDFENLADIELGALLWALEMEGWHHRMGLGKPLGFGSATIQIVSLEFLDPRARYSRLEDGWGDGVRQKAALVATFKQAMKARYGRDFEQLPNIRDLRALLAESPRLPVHYPRPSGQPDPQGRNYEWFMGNKRSGRDAGPRRVLPVAAEDLEGLPLIDRFGQVQD